MLADTVVEADHNNSAVVDSLVHNTVPAVGIVADRILAAAGHIPVAVVDRTVDASFCLVIYPENLAWRLVGERLAAAVVMIGRSLVDYHIHCFRPIDYRTNRQRHANPQKNSLVERLLAWHSLLPVVELRSVRRRLHPVSDCMGCWDCASRLLMLCCFLMRGGRTVVGYGEVNLRCCLGLLLLQ